MAEKAIANMYNQKAFV